MATVRLTQTLHQEVRGKMRRGFDLRIQQTVAAAQARISAPLFENAFRTAWFEKHGLTEDIVDKVPPGFFTLQTHVDLRSINGQEVPLPMRTFRLSKPVPHPSNDNPWHGTRIEHECMSTFAAIYKDALEQLKAISHEQKRADMAVDQIFNKCSTLRQALELWPQMLDVVPDWVVQEHNAPPEKRAKQALTIDSTAVDLLNTAAVKNKLARAAVGTE